MNRIKAGTRSRRHTGRIVAGVGTMLLALTSCASQPAAHDVSSGSGARANPALHAKLPQSIRSTGVLRVVTDASYPPASSFAADGRTIVGFEPDLARAIGAVLGVKVRVDDGDFTSLPGLARAGKTDLIMSAMTDTAEREKGLDFVDYFSAGTALVVQRSNPTGITDLQSLCGQKVAVEEKTVQADLLQREQRHCGSTPIKLDERHTNDDALLQLRTGRVAAVPMDFPPAELLTTSQRTSDEYQLASTEQYEPGPYGIGIAKNQAQLRDIVLAGLQQLIEDKSYQRILAKWHVETGALRQAAVNMAGEG